ncbi:c-type cytochrome [Herbaspirillum rubrisubalbicans]|uniref:c-type cytochrome n=1 Tax=Herbaspirillum rubrisubalbicans TaxID=80842 RepID=UPI00209DF7EB|nr:c-type cytochrome [Herbaspirillum rubrisubalbicans]MCP1572719.1 mono/diheme cytochrome c family protein [Herbaspirillum rubrisubalbicans]
MMQGLRRCLLLALTLALLLLLVGGLLVWSGWYNVSAVTQHWPPVFKLMEYAMRQSVRHHARPIEAPALNAVMASAGARHYERYCLQCHGAPGRAPDTAGLSMQPLPGPLSAAAHKWQARELYWIISNGIKMTGMPAWQAHLDERERWELVAYLQAMPQQAPQPALSGAQEETAAALPPGDIERGRVALTQYACQSCHRIPGVVGPATDVGPRLDSMASQAYVAGTLVNTAQQLARWILHPKRYKPNGAMPELGVTPQDAADMSAYLRSVDQSSTP